MIFALIALLSAVAFFGLMVAASEAGWRIGRARLARDSAELAKGAASAEAAVFGLFGTPKQGAKASGHSKHKAFGGPVKGWR